MRVARNKRFRRNLAFYELHFDIRSPYKVVANSDFISDCLASKIDLRERLISSLGQTFCLYITQCTAAILTKRGSSLGDFKVLSCQHDSLAVKLAKDNNVEVNPDNSKLLSEKWCLKALAAKENKGGFFFAVNDTRVIRSLNSKKVVPIIVFENGVFKLLDPSKKSHDLVEKRETKKRGVRNWEKETVLKRYSNPMDLINRLGDKSRRPNPLSVKKSKKKTSTDLVHNGTQSSVKKKRTRSKSHRQRVITSNEALLVIASGSSAAMDTIETKRLLVESEQLSAIDRARLINSDKYTESRYAPLVSLVEDVRVRDELRRKSMRTAPVTNEYSNEALALSIKADCQKDSDWEGVKIDDGAGISADLPIERDETPLDLTPKILSPDEMETNPNTKPKVIDHEWKHSFEIFAGRKSDEDSTSPQTIHREEFHVRPPQLDNHPIEDPGYPPHPGWGSNQDLITTTSTASTLPQHAHLRNSGQRMSFTSCFSTGLSGDFILTAVGAVLVILAILILLISLIICLRTRKSKKKPSQDGQCTQGPNAISPCSLCLPSQDRPHPPSEESKCSEFNHVSNIEDKQPLAREELQPYRLLPAVNDNLEGRRFMCSSTAYENPPPPCDNAQRSLQFRSGCSLHSGSLSVSSSGCSRCLGRNSNNKGEIDMQTPQSSELTPESCLLVADQQQRQWCSRASSSSSKAMPRPDQCQLHRFDMPNNKAASCLHECNETDFRVALDHSDAVQREECAKRGLEYVSARILDGNNPWTAGEDDGVRQTLDVTKGSSQMIKRCPMSSPVDRKFCSAEQSGTLRRQTEGDLELRRTLRHLSPRLPKHKRSCTSTKQAEPSDISNELAARFVKFLQIDFENRRSPRAMFTRYGSAILEKNVESGVGRRVPRRPIADRDSTAALKHHYNYQCHNLVNSKGYESCSICDKKRCCQEALHGRAPGSRHSIKVNQSIGTCYNKHDGRCHSRHRHTVHECHHQHHHHHHHKGLDKHSRRHSRASNERKGYSHLRDFGIAHRAHSFASHFRSNQDLAIMSSLASSSSCTSHSVVATPIGAITSTPGEPDNGSEAYAQSDLSSSTSSSPSVDVLPLRLPPTHECLSGNIEEEPLPRGTPQQAVRHNDDINTAVVEVCVSPTRVSGSSQKEKLLLPDGFQQASVECHDHSMFACGCTP